MPNLKKQRDIAVKKFTKKVEDKIRNIHSVMMEELIAVTRVDTGLLRANWKPSLNTPSSTFDTYGIDIDMLPPWPRGEMIDSDFAWMQATMIEGFKLGDTIYNTNSTPYQNNFDMEGDIVPNIPMIIMAGKAEAKR
jgi:hypothetical protein